MRKYFELEDPRTVHPIGLELKLEADLGRTRLRGIIDRLELDENGEFVVTDYKTGSVPSEFWEAKSLAGVHIYALLCERMLGRRPARVQLSTCRSPRRSSPRPPSSRSRASSGARRALYAPSPTPARATTSGPQPGRLCDFCTFKPYCPAHGGDPVDAAGAARPGHGDRAAARRSPRRPARPTRRADAARVDAVPVASTDVLAGPRGSTCGSTRGSNGSAASRSIRCSTGCRARPTTGCCGCSSARRVRPRQRRSRDRAAPGRGARRRVGCSPTDRSRRCSAGSDPRTTIRPRARCPTACAARSPARSRRATRRRRSPRAALLAGGPRHAAVVRARRRGGEQPRLHADAPRLRHRRRRRTRCGARRRRAPARPAR